MTVAMHAGRFGTLTHVPIHHLDRKLSFKELCALYSITDVALVTSLRDGMNLVSYEFVACQADNHGVLVLSEFAGAAQSLGAGSILVNPWNIDDMTTAIHEVRCPDCGAFDAVPAANTPIPGSDAYTSSSAGVRRAVSCHVPRPV